MYLDPSKIDLPIVEVFDEVKHHLKQGNTLIVNAPPGAGKSTILPLALINEPWLVGQQILMLEPRRLAARSIATRMSALSGTELGKEIGFRIRFENRVSEGTKIEVVTEGILTRRLQSDNALEGVGLVIFDEFHERSIHADIALALCREAQQVLRPDLRILIMSATLNMPELQELLKAPVVVSEGRQHKVEVLYTGESDMLMIPEMTTSEILSAVKKHKGDLLVFLPGQGEIAKCEEILRRKLPGFMIHPLYGQLPHGKQQAAIHPNTDGKRKVILATNIAETSLTIEGITVVIDSGFARVARFDPRSGLSRLETVAISKDSAAQRAGRAGRLGPGTCYRMWTKIEQQRMSEFGIPEISEADLASLLLDMAQWGVVDVQQLTWLTAPPKGNVAQASETLHQIGALENGRITKHGIRIHQVPCHPRIAHMLLMAEQDEMLSLATDVAAIIEERDPLPKEVGIDINLRIEALRRARKEGTLGRKFNRIEKVAASYRKIFEVVADNGIVNPYESGLLLVHAYPERIAFARPGNNAQFQLSNGRYAMAGHKDDLAHEAWLAVAHVNARDGMGKIFLASPLNPTDLAPLLKEQEVIKWDTRKGGLIASLEMRIGSIVLKSTPIPEPDESHLIAAISEAIKSEGEQLLDFNEDVKQWQNRVMSLRVWRPKDRWPDVSNATLVTTNAEWLTPYLIKIKKPEDLKKINLLEVLENNMLNYDQQKQLKLLAPIRLEVPSGSEIKIAYMAGGAPPILAVRIQEMFGSQNTPFINEGKTPLLLHLLSPGYKPVQVTSDLKSFWDNTYHEVRKELRIRYSKHAWPENPWQAEAIQGAKRRK